MEPKQFLVNGEWRRSGTARHVVNPYTGDVVGEVFQASAADIEEAIASAASSAHAMRRLSSHERWTVLTALSARVGEERENLARLITTEMGKPISSSRAEVERAVFTFQTAAEEARRIGGDVIPLDLTSGTGRHFGLIRRFPLGPVGGITPFNFPLNLVAHKVGPAIAAGDPIVLKPSSSAPMVSLALASIVATLPLPKGAIGVVPCLAGEASQLIEDERIRLISFTGSPAVGWTIKERAGKKRVVLELGGNAGVIIDEGTDIQAVLPRLIWGSYGNAGQSCIAVQRIYVHESLFPQFQEMFVRRSKETVVGDPGDPSTIVGPMITEAAARKVEGWIEEAASAGARVLCGGKRKKAVIEPTVIVNAKRDLNICAQEVFAPVVTLEPFGSFSEAIDRVNDSRFGLQAGVFSNSMDHVMQAYERLEVGGVIVNDVPTYRMDHMPYGGTKDSGFGREGVRFAIEEMTELKLLAVHLP